MKHIILTLVVLLALGCVTAEAKGDKKKKGKQPVEVVDTVSNTVFSYAYGVANTQGLKIYLATRMGIDTTQMAAFVRGFDGGADNDDFLSVLKAYVAGAEIRQQAEKQICTQIDKQLTGDENTQLIDRKAFVSGFRDGLLGETMMPVDSAISAVDKNSTYHTNRLMEAKYGDWRRENEAFLAANAKKDSVITLPSGLQYKVLTMGTGEKPTATDRVKVHYEGTLIDGTVFDSSYKRNQPATFGCSQVIKGWTEALTMMPVGSKWMLYIPQELAYGTRDQGKIKPFSALVFTVELLSVEK